MPIARHAGCAVGRPFEEPLCRELIEELPRRPFEDNLRSATSTPSGKVPSHEEPSSKAVMGESRRGSRKLLFSAPPKISFAHAALLTRFAHAALLLPAMGRELAGSRRAELACGLEGRKMREYRAIMRKSGP